MRRNGVATRAVRHQSPWRRQFATQRRVRIQPGFVATLVGTALATVRGMRPFNPKLDIVFKMLFASERNRGSLVALLSDVLQPTTPIVEVTVLNPETPRHVVMDKGVVLDVRVRLDDGRQAHVEMQRWAQPVFIERGLYYWSRVHSSQLSRGEGYEALKPTIGIFFLDFVELEGTRFHSVFRLLETTEFRPLTNAMELHYVELPKIPMPLAFDAVDPVLKWALFLRAESEAELEQLAMTYPELQDSVETLNQLRRDRVAQELAELREHEIATQEHRLQRAVAEAEAKGRAEGETKGRVDGETKGRIDGETKGRADGIRLSVVELCRAQGIALDDDRQKRLAAASLEELGELLRTIASKRHWPE